MVFFPLFFSPKPAKLLEVSMEGYLKEFSSLRFSLESEMGAGSALAGRRYSPALPAQVGDPSSHPGAAQRPAYIAKVLRKEAGGRGCHHAPRTFQDRLWPPGHCLPAGLMSQT